MYKQEMGISLYLNAVLLYRRKKIETKGRVSITTTTTGMVYPGMTPTGAAMELGAGGKGKEDSDIHGAIADFQEGGQSGVEEGRPTVYIGVFIEMRRKRRMEVCERFGIVGVKSCWGLRIFRLVVASLLLCVASWELTRAVLGHHCLAYWD